MHSDWLFYLASFVLVFIVTALAVFCGPMITTLALCGLTGSALALWVALRRKGMEPEARPVQESNPANDDRSGELEMLAATLQGLPEEASSTSESNNHEGSLPSRDSPISASRAPEPSTSDLSQPCCDQSEDNALPSPLPVCGYDDSGGIQALPPEIPATSAVSEDSSVSTEPGASKTTTSISPTSITNLGQESPPDSPALPVSAVGPKESQPIPSQVVDSFQPLANSPAIDERKSPIRNPRLRPCRWQRVKPNRSVRYVCRQRRLSRNNQPLQRQPFRHLFSATYRCPMSGAHSRTNGGTASAVAE